MDPAILTSLMAYVLGILTVLVVAGLRRRSAARVAASQLTGTPDEEDRRRLAAIAAAVHAVVGAHRLVYIGGAERGPMWTSIGRVIHQTSHAPHQSGTAGHG
jgi:hypothetical protein